MTTAGPVSVTPDPSIHNLPKADAPGAGLTPAQISAFRQQFIDLILQAVVSAVEGIFVPGSSASSSLTSWANNIPLIGPLLTALTGSSTTGGGGLGGLTTWASDLLGFFGITGLGTGSPSAPTVISIPILSGLFSSGTLKSSLLQPLIDAISGGFGGSSGLGFTGLNSLLSALPNAQNVVDAIANALGVGGTGHTTTQLNTYMQSIPGANIVGSIASSLISGVLSLGNIPNLPASQTTSGTFGTSLIPNITKAMSTDMQAVIDAIYQAINGGSSTGNTVASVKTGLLAIPGGNIIGSIAAGLISGVLGSGNIPNISAGSGTGKSADLQSVVDLFYQVVNGSSGTGNAVSTVGTSTQTILDGFWQSITGQTNTGNSQANVSAVVAGQTGTIGGQSALIAQIQAALSTGTADSDAFERSGAVTPNWTFVASSGTGTLDGHNFNYSGTGSSAEFVMLKNNLKTAGDAMSSTIVTNNAVPTYLISIPPYGANIDVWIRCTLFTTFATRSGVRLRINNNPLGATWVLANVVSGTATSLTSGSCGSVGAAASVSLGVNTARVFTATLNGTPIFSGGSYTDTGNVTTLGTSNRYRGFGGLGAAGLGPNLGTASMAQWAGG